jgi:hypothetical protein
MVRVIKTIALPQLVGGGAQRAEGALNVSADRLPLHP